MIKGRLTVPKQSAKGLVLAAQQSATRLLEGVWLTPDRRAAVQGDLGALEGLLNKLQNGRRLMEGARKKSCPARAPT